MKNIVIIAIAFALSGCNDFLEKNYACSNFQDAVERVSLSIKRNKASIGMNNYRKCGSNGNTTDYGYELFGISSCDAANGLPMDDYLFYTFDPIVMTLVKSYKRKNVDDGAIDVTKYQCNKV